MSYLDIDIRLEPYGDGGYRALVLRSPAGEASAAVNVLPPLQTIVDGIRAWVATGQGRARDLEQAHPEPQALKLRPLREYGLELFATLMPQDVLSRYRVSLERARAEQKGLRVRLRFDDVNLAAVPWEYIFDPLEDYLCLSVETSVVRYFDVARPPASLKIPPPLHVLGVIASPSDLPPLDVDRERAQLERSIEHLTEKGAVRIEWLQGATFRDLQGAMRRPRHVLHYIGHSGIDDRGRCVLALCGDKQNAFYLAAEDLGRLVSGHPTMRLVVLNSCESGRSGRYDLFSSAGAELIRRGVPAVVAMQFAITDKAALEFSRTFYEALVDGTALDRAVGDARRSIQIALGNTSEWGTPVLQTHSLDGVLFDVDLLPAVFPQKPLQQPAAPGQPAASGLPVAAAQQPATGPPTTTAPPPASRPETLAAERQGLLLLARKVRAFWVKGVLEQSPFKVAQIELGMDLVGSAVISPFASVLDEASRTTQRLPPGKPISELFVEEGSSLLILGEPGSGKTTTMLGLLRELLVKVETNASDPVPVVFNLSSWSEGQPLDQWLVTELSRKYQIPRKAGTTWLTSSSLLPLLDGLDEVAAQIRPACVDAINGFSQSGSCMGTVVCCRVKEYVELPNRLTLNTAIQLRELTRDQVTNWVREAGTPLAALLDVLQRDSDLLLDARSPLMLSLMAQTYRDVPVEVLAREGAESSKARRDRLMEAYVTRMFRRAGGDAGG